MKKKPKKRPDGRWQRRSKGKLFISSISQEDADRQAAEYAQALKDGMHAAYMDMTVRRYSSKWLPNNLVGVSDNYYEINAHIFDMFNKDYGDFKIKDIKPDDVKDFYTKHFTGLSDSYIQHARKILTRMFESAVENGYCRTNPVKAKSAKPHKGYTNSHRAITDEERDVIENLSRGHEMYPVAMLMLYAGLRPSEAMALRVDRDVDFDKMTITLNEFRHLSGRDAFITDTGKTKKASRTIPLFSKLVPVLKDRIGLLISYKDGQVLSKTSWEEKWGSYVSYIEQQLNGHKKRWHHRTFRDKLLNPQLHKAIADLERLGLHDDAEELRLQDWITFTVKAYDLRHSFCTMCCKQRVDIHVLMDWMGHSSAKMIQQIYDHLDKERTQNEVERVEKSLFSSQNSSQNRA